MTRLSAASAVLHKIHLGLEEHLAEKSSSNYTVKVASTDTERLEAYRLGYSVYLGKGYIEANEQKVYIEKFDKNLDTAVLLVCDQVGRVVGTLTLVLNRHNHLPCFHIFKDELSSKEFSGQAMAEMSRLALAEKQKDSSEILATLFHAALLYLYRFLKIEILMIEVNPTHVGFYKNLLGFEALGSVKDCGRVNNAPAQLMTVNLKEIDRNIALSRLKKIETVKGYRFLKYALDESVCEQLLRDWKKRIGRKLTLRFKKCASVKV